MRKQQRVEEIDIKALRRRIDEAGLPEDQARERAAILPTLTFATAFLTNRLETIRTQFREEYYRRMGVATTLDPFTIVSEHYAALILYLGAVVVIIADIFVSGDLSKQWFALPGSSAFALGAMIAVVLSIMSKAGVGLVARSHNIKVVQGARRRLELIGGISFGVTMGLVAVVFSSRSPSSDSLIDYILTFTSVALGLLGVVLPILSGALLALAHDLDWSFRSDGDTQACQMKLAAIAGLRAICEDPGRLTEDHVPGGDVPDAAAAEVTNL